PAIAPVVADWPRAATGMISTLAKISTASINRFTLSSFTIRRPEVERRNVDDERDVISRPWHKTDRPTWGHDARGLLHGLRGQYAKRRRLASNRRCCRRTSPPGGPASPAASAADWPGASRSSTAPCDSRESRILFPRSGAWARWSAHEG